MDVFKDLSLLDTSVVCRACMTEKGDFKNMFREEEFDSGLSSMFERICNVQMSAHDGLPPFICTKCILDIRSAITFSEQCLKSQIILRSSFSKRTTCLSDYLINFNDKYLGHNKFTNIDQIEDSNDISEKIMDMSMLREEVSDDDDLTMPNLKPSNSMRIFSHFEQKRDNANVRRDETISSADISHQEIVEDKTVEVKTEAEIDVETIDVETVYNTDNSIFSKMCPSIPKTEKSEIYSCNVCSFSDYNKSDVMKHKKTHLTYPCNECSQRFNNLQDFLSHLCKDSKEYPRIKRIKRLSNKELIKRGLCLLRCHLCFKEFKYVRSLRFHIRTHTGEKPALCNWCGKCFREQRALLNHIRSVHTDERKFKCSYCPKVFPVSGKKKQHERIHTGEKPYACDICGHLFSAKPTLNTHRRIHTKEFKYPCSVEGCGKGFYALSSYQQHVKAHSGERPHQCDVCDKTYLTAQHLRTHIKGAHTDLRDEICHICGNRFFAKSTLNRHLRKTHHIEPKIGSTPLV